MCALTAKQEPFALVYVECGNASEAHRRSYEVSADTKQKSIWVNGSNLLIDAKVSQRVEELQEDARALALVSVGTA